jgi:hypothetical protein
LNDFRAPSTSVFIRPFIYFTRGNRFLLTYTITEEQAKILQFIMPLLQADVAVQTSPIEAGKPAALVITLYPQPEALPEPDDSKPSNNFELIMGYVQLQGELAIDCAVIDPARVVAAGTKKLGLANRSNSSSSSSNNNSGGAGPNNGDGVLSEEDPVLFTSSSRSVLCPLDEHLLRYSDETHQYYYDDNSSYESTLKKYGLFTTARELLFVNDFAVGPSSSFAESPSSSSSTLPISYTTATAPLGTQIRQFIVSFGNLPSNLPPSYISTPTVQVKYNLIVGLQYHYGLGSVIRHSEGWYNVTVFNPGTGGPGAASVFNLDVNTPHILNDVKVTEQSLFNAPIKIQNIDDGKWRFDIQNQGIFSIPSLDTKKSISDNQKQLEQQQKEFSRFAKTLISGKGSTKSKLRLIKTHASSFSSLSSPYPSPSSPIVHNKNAANECVGTTEFSSSIPKTKFDIIYKTDKKVCDILLSKPQYSLGDTIHIVVDCTNSAYKPFHITASLETEESILETDTIFRKTIDRCTISTYSITKTKFEFALPETEPAQFRTNINEFRWVLKFQFIVLVPETVAVDTAPIDNGLEKIESSSSRHDSNGVLWRIKEHLPCDTFSCKIPLPISARKP